MQHRELVPMTVYVPPEAKAIAEKRAAEKSIAPATLLRLVLLGHEEPLR
jgi:hypothetical protein